MKVFGERHATEREGAGTRERSARRQMLSGGAVYSFRTTQPEGGDKTNGEEGKEGGEEGEEGEETVVFIR